MQAEVVHRIATLGPVSGEAIEMLRDLLARRADTSKAPAAMQVGGAKEAAAIMNATRKATEQRVMPKVAKISKETAKAIEDEMFVFEHLFGLDDKSMGTLLRGVEADVLVLAMKGVEEGQRQKFFGAMSARAADGIKDEMEARGPCKLSEVLEAQKTILQIARQMAKDGAIRLAGGGDDDYV
jgi:flagellar motor switch protein FliG